jgi:hypothetical protein
MNVEVYLYVASAYSVCKCRRYFHVLCRQHGALYGALELPRLTRDSVSFSTCVNATFKGILAPAWRHLVPSWERLSSRAKRMHYYAM